jgi:hypothetical protein
MESGENDWSSKSLPAFMNRTIEPWRLPLRPPFAGADFCEREGWMDGSLWADEPFLLGSFVPVLQLVSLSWDYHHRYPCAYGHWIGCDG